MTTAYTKRASPRAFLGKAGHFVLHYLEMCMACCVGGVTLGVAFFGGAALVGYPDLIVRAPYFSTLVLAIILTVPMVAWMRFRHHGWRPSLEMGAATMGLGIVAVALGTVGVVPPSGMFEWVTRLACPVLLTSLLLGMLQRNAPSRIVNVSSWAHRRAKLDPNDLQMREDYSPSAAYSRAKLMNVLWTYELARRLEGTGVTANLADPGGASTEMTRSEAMPWVFRAINRLGRRFMTTEKAVRSSIYLASSPEVDGVSGGYFEPPDKRVRSSKASYDEAAQKRIWEISAEFTKLDQSLPVHEAQEWDDD